jgi:DNA polymerase III delta prime subunit
MSTTESSRNYTSDDYPIIHDTYDNPQVGELESLIQIIGHKIKTRDPQIRCVKYPNLLMTSLIELNQLVGMDRLKDSIALQVMRLIDGANNGEKSSKMLNTILYGPPGVGKTKVGIILAKIWFALGYLKKPISSNINLGNVNGVNGVNGIPGTTTINTGQDINPFVFLILIVLFYGFTYIMSGISYVYNTVGMVWLLAILGITILIVLFLYINKKTYTYITNIVKVPGQQGGISIDDSNPNTIKDRDIITVVSRQDFVADYVGQTATKTKALLYANLGKVVFIDEAYSLINGDRDPFGMEALTTLNLFMSEHPDSIAIIFAGYKNIMKNGIFKIQPGLPRRCMWHFECKGYSGDQLTDIFLRQVYSEGWKIKRSDYPKIRDLICNNETMFKSYGGDTERLLFFSQLEASRCNMMSSDTRFSRFSDTSDHHYPSDITETDETYTTETTETTDTEYFNSSKSISSKIITYEHVQHGLRRLDENNIAEN